MTTEDPQPPRQEADPDTGVMETDTRMGYNDAANRLAKILDGED